MLLFFYKKSKSKKIIIQNDFVNFSFLHFPCKNHQCDFVFFLFPKKSKKKKKLTVRMSSFKVSIFGWVNKDKSIDGIKLKRTVDVPSRNDDAAASLVQDLVDAATKNVQACAAEKAKTELVETENNTDTAKNDDDENKNQQQQQVEPSASISDAANQKPSIFIKRRYFPIAPHEDPNTLSKIISNSSSSKAHDITIVSVSIIDEPTPQIRERKTVIESAASGSGRDRLKGFSLPAGSTVTDENLTLKNGLVIPIDTFIQNPVIFGGVNICGANTGGSSWTGPAVNSMYEPSSAQEWRTADDFKWDWGNSNNAPTTSKKKAAPVGKKVPVKAPAQANPEFTWNTDW